MLIFAVRMSLSSFIAVRLAKGGKKSFASLIIRLAWIGAGLSVAVMIISIAIVVGYKKQITAKVMGFGGQLEVHAIGSSGNYDYIPFFDSAHIREKITNNKQIQSVFPVMSRPGILKAEEELEGIIFKGVDGTYDFSYLQEQLVRGHLPATGDSLRKREILISKKIADRMRVDTGDRIRVYFINKPVRVIPCTITGIYETGLEETDALYVLGSLMELQRIFAQKQPQITHYEIKTENSDHQLLLKQETEINKSLPQELYAESLITLNPQIFDWLSYLDQNISIILTLMIIVACINMITALLILIIERTNMIGILKAMGTRNSRIQKIFINHAMYILILGLIFGNLFGIGLSMLQDHYKLITLAQETYYLSYVPIELRWTDILLINVGTIFVCFVTLLLPVRIINRVSPVKSIRFN